MPIVSALIRDPSLERNRSLRDDARALSSLRISSFYDGLNELRVNDRERARDDEPRATATPRRKKAAAGRVADGPRPHGPSFGSAQRFELRRHLRSFPCSAAHQTRFTPGGFHVPSPGGRIDGGSDFGQ
jgi:hypothetical protein